MPMHGVPWCSALSKPGQGLPALTSEVHACSMSNGIAKPPCQVHTSASTAHRLCSSSSPARSRVLMSPDQRQPSTPALAHRLRLDNPSNHRQAEVSPLTPFEMLAGSCISSCGSSDSMASMSAPCSLVRRREDTADRRASIASSGGSRKPLGYCFTSSETSQSGSRSCVQIAVTLWLYSCAGCLVRGQDLHGSIKLCGISHTFICTSRDCSSAADS